MSTSKAALLLGSLLVVLALAPPNASADLIFVGEVDFGGQGFGSDPINIVTGHQTGSAPGPTVESACIDAGTGSLGRQGATCAGSITGGDEPQPNPPDPKHDNPTLTELGVSSASQVGLVFNLSEPGSNELQLASGDLYLQFFNGVGYFNAFYVGPTLDLGEQGLGQAGFGFLLDATQAAAADAFCAAGTAECQVGGGFEVTNFGENIVGGQETLTAVAVTAIPEPATLLLLGSGLVGMGAWNRKRLLKRHDS